MATEMEASRLLIYYAAWRIKEKLSCSKEAAMARCLQRRRAARWSMRSHGYGGRTVLPTNMIRSGHFRDARFLLYGGGTHEVIKDFLGRMILGKL